VLAVSTIDI
jgi:hypothetical protein